MSKPANVGPVDGAVLSRDLAALAEFGRDPTGGWTRPALTPSDAQARRYVAGRMRAIGMTLTHDQVGNLIGRWSGTEAGARPVITGSHLDTVPSGGRFDGPLGVVGALGAVEALARAAWPGS